MSAFMAPARETAFNLQSLGPFSLRAAARFWSGFTPAGHPGLAADGHLHMAFPVEGSWGTGGVCVRELDGQIVAGLYGDVDPEAVRQQTARMLSMDVDGRGFSAVGRRDAVAAELQQLYPGLRPVCFYSPYEAAAWAIISQRVHMRQAASTRARLAERLGEVVDVHGEKVRAFPTPLRLLDMASFPGLSGSKVARLHAVADAALAGALDAAYLRSVSDAEALAHLQSLPGIGPFSSQLILLRGAAHPDYLTFEEPRFRRAVAELYHLDHTASDDELRVISENWRPYRTWMTFLLRQHLDQSRR
jgi:DNA-3-methyladenine glycosylase II